MNLSATEAAFEGFRIARERPWTIVAIAAIHLAVTLLGIWLLTDVFQWNPNALIQEAAAPTQDVDRAVQMLGRTLQAEGAILFVAFVELAVFAGAIYRIVLRPDERGFAFLRLAADELRLFGVLAVLFALWMAATMVVSFLLAGVAAIADPAGGAAAMALAFAIMVIVAIFGGVRLSLSGPMTFAAGRLRIFASWQATEGRFWPLLRAYGLAAAMAVLVWGLVSIILIAIAAIFAGGVQAAAALAAAEPKHFADYLQPVRLIALTLRACASALTYAIVLAPAAIVHRSLFGTRRP